MAHFIGGFSDVWDALMLGKWIGIPPPSSDLLHLHGLNVKRPGKVLNGKKSGHFAKLSFLHKGIFLSSHFSPFLNSGLDSPLAMRLGMVANWRMGKYSASSILRSSVLFPWQWKKVLSFFRSFTLDPNQLLCYGYQCSDGRKGGKYKLFTRASKVCHLPTLISVWQSYRIFIGPKRVLEFFRWPNS